jgi:hypothetical protein
MATDTTRARAYLAEAGDRASLERAFVASAEITAGVVYSCMDIPYLVAALEAAFETAERWERSSAGYDAQAECAGELRRVVAAELLSKGDGHGRD